MIPVDGNKLITIVVVLILRICAQCTIHFTLYYSKHFCTLSVIMLRINGSVIQKRKIENA